MQMAETTVDVGELSDQWPEVLAKALKEGHVVVTEGSVPKARIIPLQGQRILGLHPGAIQTTDDFDVPLADEFWMGSA